MYSKPTQGICPKMLSLLVGLTCISAPSVSYAAYAWDNLDISRYFTSHYLTSNASLSFLAISVLILSLLCLVLLLIRTWQTGRLKSNQLPPTKPYHLVVGSNAYNHKLIATSWANKPLLVVAKTKDIWSVHKEGEVVQSNLNSTQQVIDWLDINKLQDCVLGMEDDDANIDFAITLLENVAKEELPKKPQDNPFIPRIFIRIEHYDLANLFKQHASHIAPNIDITVYSVQALLVRELFAQQPFLSHQEDIVNTNDDYEVAIIGTGALAKEIVGYLANLAHLPKQNTLRINVIDKQATHFVEQLHNQFSGLKRIPHLHLNAITADRHSPEYYQHTLWHTPNLINVFIATPSAQDNMDIALNLKNIIYVKTIAAKQLHTQIGLATYDNSSQVAMLETAKQNKSFAKFYTFANYNQALSADNLFNNPIDNLAKLINFSYNNIQGDLSQEAIDKRWSQLSNHKKQSSKSQAQHLDIKLLALGLKKVANPHLSFDDLWQQNANVMGDCVIGFDFYNAQAQQFTPDQFPTNFDATLIEQLARAEHNRWNAFHYLLGWQHQADKQGRDDMKLHYCLMPIEDFDTDLIKSTYQYDLQAVMHIPKYLAYMHYELVHNT